MSGRKKDAASLRARGIAALLCGERPAVVARELGVPEGTVRSWKHRAKRRGIATLKKGTSGRYLPLTWRPSKAAPSVRDERIHHQGGRSFGHSLTN